MKSFCWPPLATAATAAAALTLCALSACSSPSEPDVVDPGVFGPDEPYTISPDVLSLVVELGQVRREPYIITELTNDSEEEISQTEVSIRFWNGSTEVYDVGFSPSGPQPGVTLRDSMALGLLDDLSEFECYTYRFAVSPAPRENGITELTSKTYAGTCPDDHPSL